MCSAHAGLDHEVLGPAEDGQGIQLEDIQVDETPPDPLLPRRIAMSVQAEGIEQIPACFFLGPLELHLPPASSWAKVRMNPKGSRMVNSRIP